MSVASNRLQSDRFVATIADMDILSDLRQRLRAAPSLVAVQAASGVSYRHLLRIRNDERADITLSVYNAVDRALNDLKSGKSTVHAKSGAVK